MRGWLTNIYATMETPFLEKATSHFSTVLNGFIYLKMYFVKGRDLKTKKILF